MTTEEKLKEMLGDYYQMGSPGSPNAAILQNILGADNELRDPQSENEALLKLIYEDVIGAVYDARDEAQAAAEAAGTAAEAVANKAPAITDTASGSIASFPDGAEGLPVKSLVVNIEPVQAGTGDPSPDNVRPITGWTGANVTVSPTLDPQDGTTIPITWQTEAGTVYGGTDEVVSGSGKKTMEIVDLGTLNWDMYTSASNIPVFYAHIDDMRISGVNSALCSILKPTDWQTLTARTENTICPHPSLAIVYAATSDYTDAATFKAAMAGQTYVYPLATPTDFSTTPTQIDTLLGQNNIFADCGPVDVEYRADTKLYIKRLTGPTDDDMTADANIASGTYFMVGNNLFLSTASIAAGEAIVPGTNCTATNLAAALNALQ